ncbi:hypothetical protein HHL16_04160 [Pseudoflavitalea sp. G-6-1-2]|uniref:hypothetical protein n=1 Tax=Pseudoflavitalea sp. G-6-1-2 TaxID=2728841 RepID=UPI00146EBBF9|nr:hypothetical protein [Pseudoflavitalea sp. G-6-1-2]NML20052.1 hypothetical protein [Pseudoflavitalea sp. G-6-1-2]
MKSTVPVFISAAILLVACSKSKDNNPDPSKDPPPITEGTRLDQFENSNFIYKFTYNDQQQLTGVAQTFKSNPTLTLPELSATIAWSNGKPVTAEITKKEKNAAPYRFVASKFNYSGDRLAYTSHIAYKENGSEIGKDTIYFEYNSSGQLSGTRKVIEGEVFLFKWNNLPDGNIIRTSTLEPGDNELVSQSFEEPYDKNTNPFSLNGVGRTLFLTDITSIEMPELLLAKNNLSGYKERVKRQKLNTSGQVTRTQETNTDIQFSLVYNNQNLLNNSKADYAIKSFLDGKQIVNISEKEDRIYTLGVKK